MKNPSPVPLEEYNKLQCAEILSPLNIWGTGEELRRRVNLDSHDDRNALFNHWVEYGGCRRFRERYELLTD